MPKLSFLIRSSVVTATRLPTAPSAATPPHTHPIALGLLALPYLHHLKEEIAGLVGIIGEVSYTIRFPMEILQ